MKKLCLIILWLISGMISLSHAAGGNISLPDMGDRASTYLSPKEEKKLGQVFMGWVNQHMTVIEDPEVTEYINALGYKLVAHSDKNTLPFYFFVVDDDSINAFAGPGGVIGVHSGLIQNTKNESELAAVLAHEIAHVTQRHLARAYEAASQSNLPTAAAILAAILIGNKNSQLGEAALMASIAGNIQGRINFTRSNEIEADAIGISLLAYAGFDAEGMPGFFAQLYRKTELSDGTNLPEMLRTHPLTLSRITQARARLNRWPQSKRTPQNNELSYRLIKQRLLSLSGHWQPVMHQNAKTSVEAYANVLVMTYLGRTQEAIVGGKALLQKDSFNTAYQMAYVRALWEEKKYRLAVKRLKNYKKNNTENEALYFYYAKSIFLMGKYKKTVRLIEKKLRHSSRLYFYPLLSMAEKSRGNAVASHETLATYFSSKGLFSEAIEHLDIALRRATKNSDKARLEKQLKILQELSEE